MRPLCTVGDGDRSRLAARGINTLTSMRSAEGVLATACTLAGPGAATSEWRSLPRRRLALFILSTIERGTRWTLFEANGPALWDRATAQLSGFLESLEREGAFADRPPGERWFVVCDERVNRDYERDRGAVNLLFGFAAGKAGHFHSFVVSHRAAGSRVRPLGLTRQLAEAAHADLLLADLVQEPVARTA
jgi:phage tail sheath protein FI